MCVRADSHICINSTYFYIYMDTNYLPPTIGMYMYVKMPIMQPTLSSDVGHRLAKGINNNFRPILVLFLWPPS